MAEYNVSWVKQLINGVWERTFAFAHAKTVYTDFANKKTLADKLVEIDTVMGNKADSDAVPTKVSQLTNDSNYQTDTEVKSAVAGEVAKIVGGASADFDTLKEMEDWISGHEEGAAAMNSAIKKNAEDISSHVSDESAHVTEEDKKKLAGIEEGANKTVVDSELSSSSTNPVQNKVVKAEIDAAVEYIEKEKADRSEITTNSLDCTMQYAEGCGLTVTRLNDGTYNIVGTATDDVVIPLTNQSDVLKVPEDSILLGCKGGSTVTYGLGVLKESTYSEVFDGEACRLLAGTYDYAYIFVRNGVAINTVMEPMITTNIRATNYVPYTGDTGNIAKDVSHIRGKILDGVMTKKIQLVSNTRKDLVRTIEPIEGFEGIKIPPVIVSPRNNKTMDNTYNIGSSGGGGVHTEYSDYTYARSSETTFDILDACIDSSVKQDGITATYRDAKSLSSDKKFYTVKGTATADTKINLYSVTAPASSEKIYFSFKALSAKATVDTYYIEISDAAGNVINVVGGETSKTMSTHSGKVTVCLVVKSGVKLTNVTVNVKAGYSKQGLVADFYPVKYSDTVDNVCDAVLDLKTRLDGMNKVVFSESITISSANTDYFLTMLGIGLYYLQAVTSWGGTTYAISHIATVAIGSGMPVIQLDGKTGPMMKFVSMQNPNASNVNGLGIYSQGVPVTVDITIIKIV